MIHEHQKVVSRGGDDPSLSDGGVDVETQYTAPEKHYPYSRNTKH